MTGQTYSNSSSSTIAACTVASDSFGWQPTLTVTCSNGVLLTATLSHKGSKGARYADADLFMRVDEGGRHRLKTTTVRSGGREGWVWSLTPTLVQRLRLGSSVFFWFDAGSSDTEQVLNSARFGLKGSSAAIKKVTDRCD